MSDEPKSKVQEDIESMADGQFAELRALVERDAERRASPYDHLGDLNDYEFQKLFGRACYEGDRGRQEEAQARALRERERVALQNLKASG